ncbi:MAG: hypothetical protein DMF63_05705 [Acidobacteria bacterium]|nr:MAG: hypothetical protein DMF63_05705 [Acidobacteriota bacterium]
MKNNFLTLSRFSSRLVATLVILLIQLPIVSPALDLGRSIEPTAFNPVSQSHFSSAAGPLTVFSNATGMTIADATAGGPGVSSLYPSPITVSALAGTISDINVTINGLTAPRPRDLDLLLVGPTGIKFVLFGDAGGTGAACAVAGINITIDDGAATQIPEGLSCPPVLTTASYRPANYTGTIEPDAFPAPAPGSPYNQPTPTGSATLSVFNATNPNGTWNLYVVDDALGGGTSTISGGWSIDITTVGGIDPTTTTITSNLNPALTTQPITFTSTTINNTTALPVAAGTVTFTNNSVNITGCINVAVNASGQAACTATLAEGTRIIAANYSGTATLGASNGSLSEVVNSPTVPTGAQFCNNGGMTIVDASTSAPVYPSTVSVSGLFGTIASMTTQINGFTSPRPANIDFLLVGSNNVGFTFMSDIGDSVTAASNLNFIFSDAGATQPPQAALSSGTFRPTDYDPPADPDTFPAPAPGGFSAPAPAGAATFGSLYNASNPNGNWRLYAVDDGVGGGNSTITGWCVSFAVTPFTTTTSVSSSANPSVFGQPVTFTATVSSAGGTPSGNVQFFDGVNPIGGSIALDGSGQAALTISSLSVGNHTITAQYGGVSLGPGGGGYAASTGSLVGNPQVVNKAGTTIVLGPNINPTPTGQPVIFTATVSPVAPGAGTRTGTVTFFRNGSPVCTNPVNASGQSACVMIFTIAGNYDITATYNGDGNFLASTTASPVVEMAIGPTAANANISGRVLDESGRGISGARVSVLNQVGEIRWAITNPFGYYRFFDVPSGETYLISVTHKRYVFESRSVSVLDDLTEFNFTPIPQSRQTGTQSSRHSP